MIHVSTTCPDLDTARSLAQAALAERLAACANITPGILSLFHWQDDISEDEEVQITFKTTEAARAELVKLIEIEHPYELPVITWETVGATREAEDWLAWETRRP
ncbi:divalent-cation tolerance protein CutA [Rhodovulum euryhalinum]|uniref:Periplasmic divalent cation tolerance protein n=1 Tax=Rhodovulum euryhalinum TaxID=35805 RepID=A0A4R2KSE1_9RHOB|nr:divalent-cation tolerance protein CutA [Rhodovulum euryhalinum]TCO73926.1 periplasmic divalent cation tolerance protein [Rhodovulum euryhalinum]